MHLPLPETIAFGLAHGVHLIEMSTKGNRQQWRE